MVPYPDPGRPGRAGVPTVPFLLATSYYLARSSPGLNERLRRTAFFGPILREWEGHRALSLASKGKLIGLTATTVVVTVVLAPLTPLALRRDPADLVARRLRRRQDARPHGRRAGQSFRGNGNHLRFRLFETRQGRGLGVIRSRNIKPESPISPRLAPCYLS